MKKNGKEESHAPEIASPNRVPAFAISILGMLIGVLILVFHPLDSVFVKYILSERATFINWYPATFQHLNLLSGISLLTLSVLYLLYALCWKEPIDSFLENRYPGWLILLIGGMVIMAFSICCQRFFDMDEIEHIHSAWYIKEGFIPYRDFFEHHNPLFWYTLLPMLHLGGESVNTLLIARLFMGCVMLGIVYFAFLIASTVCKSRETGFISALLLCSNPLFIEKCVEIRPDGPQVLFSMISIYFFLRFITSRKDKDMFYSGVAAAVSFLFLQKAIFLVIAYGMIFAYRMIRGKLSPKSLMCFMGGLLMPLLLFTSILLATHSFHDYILTNWQLNWRHLGASEISSKPLRTVSNSLMPNMVLGILAIASVFYILLKRGICEEMKIMAFFGLVQICSLAFFSTSFKHYYLLPVSLFSISGAFLLTETFDAFKIIRADRVALATATILWALPFLLIDNMNTNRFQLEKMSYVLKVTNKNDIVYDGANNFNLFRHDLHYFWFQLSQLKNYNSLTDDRFADFDCCTLIRAKRPRIINELHLDFMGCGLDALYGRTMYPGLYVRKERSN